MCNHVVYSGKKTKGALTGELAYIGINSKSPGRLSRNKNKDSIQVEEIEGDNVNDPKYKVIFSVDKRDKDALKKALGDERDVLDSSDLENQEKMGCLRKAISKKGFETVQDEPLKLAADHPKPTIAALYPQLSDEKIKIKIGARDIEIEDGAIKKNVVIAVDLKDSKSESKRKVVYITEKNGKLIIDSCDNNDFKKFCSKALLAFYVKKEDVKVVKGLLEKDIKEEDAVYSLTKEAPEKIVARLNACLNKLQDDGKLEQFLKYPDHDAARLSFSPSGKLVYTPEAQEKLLNDKKSSYQTPQLPRKSMRLNRTSSLRALKRTPSTSSVFIAEPERVTVRFESESTAVTKENAHLFEKLSLLGKKLDGLKDLTDIVCLYSALTEVNTKLNSKRESVDLTVLEQEIGGIEEKINSTMAEIISASRSLQQWINNNKQMFVGKTDSLTDKLNVFIGKITVFKDRTTFPTESFAFKSMAYIVSILNMQLSSQLNGLEAYGTYKKCMPNIEARIKGELLNIAKKEDGFKGFSGRISAIINIGNFVKDFVERKNTFSLMYREYTGYVARQQEFINGLDRDPRLDAEKTNLISLMDAWKKELDEFIPFTYDELGREQTLQDPVLLNDSTVRFKASFDETVARLEHANQLILDEKNASRAIFEDKRSRIFTACFEDVSTLLPNLHIKHDKLFKEGNKKALEKANLLKQIEDKVAALGDEISQPNDKIIRDIQEVKGFIQSNKEAMSAYRSKWGSAFFFGTLLRMNLDKRVASKHLIDDLSDQLDEFQRSVEEKLPSLSVN